jgi:hypothetical protein
LINPVDLEQAINKITDEILGHCEHGSQNDLLGNMKACGQFFGIAQRKRKQRGLHGTAAAIYVLSARGNDSDIQMAQSLLEYAREQLTEKPVTDAEVDQDYDFQNTIKISEVLASINANMTRSDYADQLRIRLQNAQNKDTGAWSYYLDEGSDSDIPTCYALLALGSSITPEKLLKIHKYLWSVYDELEPNPSADPNAFARKCLILHAISQTIKESSSKDIQRKLTNSISAMWKRSYAQYGSDIEVMISYFRDYQNHYIRLPWQFYLAGALVRTNPSQFYSIRFQRYLARINESALKGGFANIIDSPFRSTRSNAILISLFRSLISSKPKSSFFASVRDRISEWWSVNWVRFGFVIVACSCSMYYFEVSKEFYRDTSSVILNVVATALYSLLAWIYAVGKRF